MADAADGRRTPAGGARVRVPARRRGGLATGCGHRQGWRAALGAGCTRRPIEAERRAAIDAAAARGPRRGTRPRGRARSVGEGRLCGAAAGGGARPSGRRAARWSRTGSGGARAPAPRAQCSTAGRRTNDHTRRHVERIDIIAPVIMHAAAVRTPPAGSRRRIAPVAAAFDRCAATRPSAGRTQCSPTPVAAPTWRRTQRRRQRASGARQPRQVARR